MSAATSVASVGRRVEQLVAHAIRTSGQFRGLRIAEAHTRQRLHIPALIVRADETGPWDDMPTSTGCREVLLSLQLVANTYDTPQEQIDQWASDVMSMTIDSAVLKEACNAPDYDAPFTSAFSGAFDVYAEADERLVTGVRVYDVLHESTSTTTNGAVVEMESLHRLPVGIHD